MCWSNKVSSLIDKEHAKSKLLSCWIYAGVRVCISMWIKPPHTLVWPTKPKYASALCTSFEWPDIPILEIRREVEACDIYPEFLLWHGLGGGVGSGTACRVLEYLSDNHPKSYIASASILPISIGMLNLRLSEQSEDWAIVTLHITLVCIHCELLPQGMTACKKSTPSWVFHGFKNMSIVQCSSMEHRCCLALSEIELM